MVVQAHRVLADKAAGQVRVAVFQGLDDFHVIDDGPAHAVVLAHGTAADGMHVLEQAVRRLAQEGAV